MVFQTIAPSTLPEFRDILKINSDVTGDTLYQKSTHVVCAVLAVPESMLETGYISCVG